MGMGFEWVIFGWKWGLSWWKWGLSWWKWGFELVIFGVWLGGFWMRRMERGSGRWNGPLSPAIFASFIRIQMQVLSLCFPLFGKLYLFGVNQ